MSTLATLKVALTTDHSELDRGFDHAEQRASGFKGAVGNAATMMAGFVGAQLIMEGVGKAFDLATSAVFGLNSNIEQTTTVFTALMGSSSKASAHVKDLLEFAKTTPFPTESIEAASLKLFKLGGSSLDTMGNLKLMGNAAAGLGLPITDITENVARFHAILDSGQPVTRALRPMMLMGLITPQVAEEIGKLSKAHASHAQVMQVLMNSMDHFNGAMERQKGTWEGVQTVFSNTIADLSAKTFKPFFSLAEQGLGRLNEARWILPPSRASRTRSALG